MGPWLFFRYQHVGISKANCLRWGPHPTQRPNASGFALQWNIGCSSPIDVIVLRGKCPKGVVVLVGNSQKGSCPMGVLVLCCSYPRVIVSGVVFLGVVVQGVVVLHQCW